MVKVYGPRTYLIETGHKTRAHEEPNETRELDIPVPELSEQSNLSTDNSQVSASMPQLPVNFSDQDSEPNSSIDKEHAYTPSPVVLQQSERIRKPVVQLEL